MLPAFQQVFSNRMLKKASSFVLASLKASTYRAKRVRLGLSFAAAALDGLFDHPECLAEIFVIFAVFSLKRVSK